MGNMIISINGKLEDVALATPQLPLAFRQEIVNVSIQKEKTRIEFDSLKANITIFRNAHPELTVNVNYNETF